SELDVRVQTAGTVEFDFPREKSSELGWCGGKSLAEARLRSLIPLPCAKSCAKGRVAAAAAQQTIKQGGKHFTLMLNAD
uniref:Uncharacterized protein n=1 Tax=Anopheles quadriannulatus TaxID=34691 RepID=A0A182XRF3_ANOQN